MAAILGVPRAKNASLRVDGGDAESRIVQKRLFEQSQLKNAAKPFSAILQVARRGYVLHFRRRGKARAPLVVRQAERLLRPRDRSDGHGWAGSLAKRNSANWAEFLGQRRLDVPSTICLRLR